MMEPCTIIGNDISGLVGSTLFAERQWYEWYPSHVGSLVEFRLENLVLVPARPSSDGIPGLPRGAAL